MQVKLVFVPAGADNVLGFYYTSCKLGAFWSVLPLCCLLFGTMGGKKQKYEIFIHLCLMLLAFYHCIVQNLFRPSYVPFTIVLPPLLSLMKLPLKFQKMF